MGIDRSRLTEFPLLIRQAHNPSRLVNQIVARVNSFKQTTADHMTPSEGKQFTHSLYNGGTIAQWPSIPRSAVAQITPLVKGLVGDIMSIAVGNHTTAQSAERA